MLTSILPGIRTLRTPLAIGCTWFVALWLLLRDYAPRPSKAEGALKSLYELGSLVGQPAIIASVTFAAYLFGALIELDPSQLMRWLYRKADLPRSRLPKLPLLTLQAKGDLARLKTVAESPSSDSMLLAMATGSNMYGVERQFFSELPHLVTRLLAVNKDLYDDYDRTAAEANLRFNMAPPLTALFFVLAVQENWLWSLALLLPCGLLWQGIAKARRANDIVIQALLIGQIDSSILENMWRSAIIRFERRAAGGTGDEPTCSGPENSNTANVPHTSA